MQTQYIPSDKAQSKSESESENRLNEKQKLDTMKKKEGKTQAKERRENAMGQSKAQTKATNNYRKSHYESFLLQFPKGTKAKLSDYAKAHNFQSLTDLICYLLEKETGISCKLGNGLAWLKK